MKITATLIAVLSILSQGCASIRQSNFGEVPSSRPAITDALRGGQRAVPGFGGARNVGQVPASLPIPIEANPVARLRAPVLGASGSVYGTASNVYQFLSCFTLINTNTSACVTKAEREFRLAVPPPSSPKGPVILR